MASELVDGRAMRSRLQPHSPRLRFVSRGALLSLCLGMLACGVLGSGRSSTVVKLREQAEAKPQDADLWAELAEAEMFAAAGEAARVEGALSKALALQPKSGHLHLLKALHAEAHGQPQLALDHLLKGLPALAKRADPLSAAEAELAANALQGLNGMVAGFADAVRPLMAVAPQLPAPARWALQDLFLQLAQRSGEPPEVDAWAKRMGCVTGFRSIGPFGPRDLLSFDADHGVDLGEPLLSEYDLGPRRGVQPTRVLGAQGCAVHLGGDAIGAGGTRYVQARLDNRSDSEALLLRIDTPNAFELYVDGERRLRVDRRREPAARALYLPLTLSEGEHWVGVRVTSRHPNPVLTVALRPLQDQDLRAVALTEVQGSPYRRFLRAAVEMARGNPVAARLALAKVQPNEKASPYLLAQRAAVALADPLVPEDKAADQARALLTGALRRDGELWSPLLQLASFTANNGRLREAILEVREISERFPHVPAVGLALASLLQSQGWDEAADQEIARVRKLVPDACTPLAMEVTALLERQREVAARPAIDALMACDAQSNARYGQLMRNRDWSGAAAELSRLETLSSPQSRFNYLLSGLSLAKRTDDWALRAQLIGEVKALFPRSALWLEEALDGYLEQGQQRQALKVLEDALKAEPASMAAFYRLLPVLGGSHPLHAYRRDGLAEIKAFEASGRSYEGPQVLVFDYMALRLFEDGSSLELVHTVQRPQSAEAIDEMAEVAVPDGARVLKLRVVKADGRLLEPDAIDGKDTVSMPNVAVGDYIEFEYMRELEPADGFPEGYLGDRFYFSSFEVPFDHSEMVVVSPKDVPLLVDPRGDAPAAKERRKGNLIERRFTVERSVPLMQEPGSVSPREYIPSVRVGFQAGFPEFIDSMREMLSDRSMVDPTLKKLAESVVGDAAPGDHRLRAERLYAFVLDRMENDSDVFSQAATMLRARQGNRARVLQYLLTLVDVPADLVLVRSAGADRMTGPQSLADTETFEHLLVRVGSGKDALWLFTAERHAPFGYVPSVLRGQPALPLNGVAVTVPQAPPESELRTLDAEVTLGEDGAALVIVREEVRGASAVSWRNQLEGIPESELEHRFEEEYAARLLPGARLRSLEISGRERTAQSLTLSYELEVFALARRTTLGWAVPQLFRAELASTYAGLPTRTTTEFTGAPVQLDVRVRMQFPSAARRPEAPQTVALGGPMGQAEFTRAARYEQDALVFERNLRLPALWVEPATYAEFARFCREVDAAEDLEVEYKL